MVKLIIISPLVIALSITVLMERVTDINNPKPSLSGWKGKLVSVVLISLMIVWALSSFEFIGMDASASRELAGTSFFSLIQLAFWGRKRKETAVINLGSH